MATSRAIAAQPSTGGQSCQVPAAEEDPAACSAPLDDDVRDSLDALCAGDFNDRCGAETLRRVLGQGGASCLYLCEFGAARWGQAPEELVGFPVEYGDRVAALFSLGLVDARAVTSAGCAGGLGRIEGTFSFKVRRGTAAQPFP